MLRQLQVSIAALFTAMTLCSCNLDLGSGSTSAEIDQVLADRIAAENAANQPAAAPAANNNDDDKPAAAPSTPVAKPSSAPASTGGTGGFLWKPVSDSNGNLVVLLPSQYNGKLGVGQRGARLFLRNRQRQPHPLAFQQAGGGLWFQCAGGGDDQRWQRVVDRSQRRRAHLAVIPARPCDAGFAFRRASG